MLLFRIISLNTIGIAVGQGAGRRPRRPTQTESNQDIITATEVADNPIITNNSGSITIEPSGNVPNLSSDSFSSANSLTPFSISLIIIGLLIILPLALYQLFKWLSSRKHSYSNGNFSAFMRPDNACNEKGSSNARNNSNTFPAESSFNRDKIAENNANNNISNQKLNNNVVMREHDRQWQAHSGGKKINGNLVSRHSLTNVAQKHLASLKKGSEKEREDYLSYSALLSQRSYYPDINSYNSGICLSSTGSCSASFISDEVSNSSYANRRCDSSSSSLFAMNNVNTKLSTPTSVDEKDNTDLTDLLFRTPPKTQRRDYIHENQNLEVSESTMVSGSGSSLSLSLSVDGSPGKLTIAENGSQ